MGVQVNNSDVDTCKSVLKHEVKGWQMVGVRFLCIRVVSTAKLGKETGVIRVVMA